MSFDPDIVGRSGPEARVAWSETDVMLYALAVGAGRDPSRELQLTTENSEGARLQPLPTFGLVLVQRSDRPEMDSWDPARAVHGEQQIAIRRPLPAAGSLLIRSTITAVEDKGSGALVTVSSTARDPDSGSVTFTSDGKIFLRGLGGFGPTDAKPSTTPWVAPEGEPALSLRSETRADQALLYRLLADRNPLHSDPAFARRAGYERPILHGLCTYGSAVRELINALCDGDPRRVSAVDGRFSRPLYPGTGITVNTWTDGPGAVRFQAVDDAGAVVIDRGRFEFTSGDDADEQGEPI